MSKLYELDEYKVKKRIVDIISDFPWEFFKDELTIETIDYTITIKKKETDNK